MKKIIDGREFEYNDDVEFYDGLPIREVVVVGGESACIEVITEKPFWWGVGKVKHVLTFDEYAKTGITFLSGKRCKECGARI